MTDREREELALMLRDLLDAVEDLMDVTSTLATFAARGVLAPALELVEGGGDDA